MLLVHLGGASVIEPAAEGIVLFLGDQPLVQPSTVSALVAQARTAELAVCSYDDGLGHPFWLGRGLFDRLATLHGDKAVWKLVDAAGDDLVTVAVTGAGPDRRRHRGGLPGAAQAVRFGGTMTPTQLRAFATVVRLGSVKAAAADLGVTEAAVSLHVGQLRRELGDQLFNRTASGLAFTPGGLRLASRAVEMLGLQDRTVLEVREAGARPPDAPARHLRAVRRVRRPRPDQPVRGARQGPRRRAERAPDPASSSSCW